jgi:hypothetical protein
MGYPLLHGVAKTRASRARCCRSPHYRGQNIPYPPPRRSLEGPSSVLQARGVGSEPTQKRKSPHLRELQAGVALHGGLPVAWGSLLKRENVPTATRPRFSFQVVKVVRVCRTPRGGPNPARSSRCRPSQARPPLGPRRRDPWLATLAVRPLRHAPQGNAALLQALPLQDFMARDQRRPE